MPARIPMTGRQRTALLALPNTDAMVVRYHSLDASDLDAIGTARTPATRLGYTLQLCCLRYPGRHLRAGELLPAIMLDHIAEQIGVEADVIADFARRTPTRYDQLATIKARFGFRDLTRPVRTDLMTWLGQTAMPLTDGCYLLDRLLEKMRSERIVIPGISVVERMAAEAMHRAETDLITAVDCSLDAEMRRRLDTLDTLDADAAIIRRTASSHRDDVLGEIAPEYRAFKRSGPAFLRAFDFHGRVHTQSLRAAMTILADLDGDWRRALPDDVPLGHVERRWRRHVGHAGAIDRTSWEMATYEALAGALASSDIWVPTAKVHRALRALLAPAPGAPPRPAILPGDAHAWLDERANRLDTALLAVERNLGQRDAVFFESDRLRFPRKPSGDTDRDGGRRFALACYARLPATRITDLLSQVDRWTGFTHHFTHVSTGLPPGDDRAFLATLIAEATNLGLSRMAEVCGVGSRRTLLRMQTWHMREETFRAALACLTDAIHAEPLAAWFGQGRRASADGQAFPLGGPGEAGGTVNAHYGRDPVVKIYTTITDRYAPLHQSVMAGTAGEAIHALDGIHGHAAGVDPATLHVDGGGVSDIVFAVSRLLGLDFEPRIPRLSDRRLYAFEPARHYGRLAPLFGRRLDRDRIVPHWPEIAEVIGAIRNRTVTPSLILGKLSAQRQQGGLAAALREIGRIERTLFTLRWFEDADLRRTVTAELNKGEARNSLARAVAFHRLGRFRDRGLENQQTRAAALNLVTAAIILFNCRYLGRVVEDMRHRGVPVDQAMLAGLSPLGWDRINLTGDYVWAENPELDADGFMPLLTKPLP